MSQSLRHKLKSILSLTTKPNNTHLLRSLSTVTNPSPKPHQKRPTISRDALYKRLSAIGATGDKVSNVLYDIARKGYKFPKQDLLYCLKMLRKYGRYQHCLEILEWMEKGKFPYSDQEHALWLGTLYRLKGFEEAQKYFDSLPPDMKKGRTYGALLYCYCKEKLTDKALSLFEEMKEMNYTSNNVAYNNIIGLHMAVGLPEKVPPLVEEMKLRKVPLNYYTYCLLMQSYASQMDFEGVERVVEEIQQQDRGKDRWEIYSNLAIVYMNAGSEKAELFLNKLEELADRSKDRRAYHFLISLTANNRDLDGVNRVWGKLNEQLKLCNNSSYVVMLHALANLGDIEGLKKCYDEWGVKTRFYDVRVPSVVIGAFLKRDMLEDAELVLKDVMDKSTNNIWEAHVKFINYYLDKRQIDCALRHMEIATDNRWKPYLKRLSPFFEYFIETMDVDGAERLTKMIKKVLNLDSEIYLWLLQTYAASGKTAPEMRRRMKNDGVNIQPEHEELLATVCPDTSSAL